MNENLNKELANRSVELAELSRMAPDDRIARLVWSRIQNDLEQEDSLVYGMQYCISNIYHFIKKQIQESEQTQKALNNCTLLIEQLGWKIDVVISKDQSQIIFVEYIKEVVAMYTDTRQNHCEDAQCVVSREESLSVPKRILCLFQRGHFVCSKEDIVSVPKRTLCLFQR